MPSPPPPQPERWDPDLPRPWELDGTDAKAWRTAMRNEGLRPLISETEVDELGPFDGDELVRWAQLYGHPEGWVKRAQAAHGRAEAAEAQAERYREALERIVEVTGSSTLQHHIAREALAPVAEREEG